MSENAAYHHGESSLQGSKSKGICTDFVHEIARCDCWPGTGLRAELSSTNRQKRSFQAFNTPKTSTTQSFARLVPTMWVYCFLPDNLEHAFKGAVSSALLPLWTIFEQHWIIDLSFEKAKMLPVLVTSTLDWRGEIWFLVVRYFPRLIAGTKCHHVPPFHCSNP